MRWNLGLRLEAPPYFSSEVTQDPGKNYGGVKASNTQIK